MNFLRVLLCLAALLFTSSESAKILGLFTSPSPSHVIIHMSVAKALIEQGHELTVVTTIPLKDKNPKYKHIILAPDEEVQKTFEKGMAAVSGVKTKSTIDKLKHDFRNVALMTNMQYDAIRRSEFQNLLKTEKFDLLIHGFFFNDFQMVVGAQLNIPVVISWLVGPIGPINDYAGNPVEKSYVPNMFFATKQPMNFGERIVNFLTEVFLYAGKSYGNYKYSQYYE